jgi:DNA-binding transcriptional MerR regulator
MAGLTIGKFAAAEGVGVETVRFYQRRGLLALPERRNSGFREYSEADRWRLAFIRRARLLGFTLGEIRELLGPAEARSTDDIMRAAQAKLAEIAEEYADKLDVVKLNIDENPATAQKYHVMAVPMMNVISGGEVVKQVLGAKPKSALLRDFSDFI